ncbi:MAG: carboxy terminal-processing peptidase [Pseudomonadota bacterium]
MPPLTSLISCSTLRAHRLQGLIAALFTLACVTIGSAEAGASSLLIEDTAAALAAKPVALSADREEVKAGVNVVRQLQSHYRQQPVDSTLSSRLFDQYLKSLDDQRMYFYSADIAELEKLRPRFDRALRVGDLDPAFQIFNRYQLRSVERLQYLIAELDKGIERFDFGKDESIELDRKEARWPGTTAEMNDLWRRRLKTAILDMRLSGKPDAEVRKLLGKRYRNQLNRTLQVRAEDAFSTYMNALTALYDPHTEYLSPQTSQNFNINMSLQLEGIGAVLQSEDEYTKIVKLVTGGPAERSGLVKPADRIVSVAQGAGELVDIVGWRLDEVVELIRGAKGSQVRLEIIPAAAKDSSETRIVTLTRDAVKLEEQAARKKIIGVTSQGQKFRVGVITLPTFYIDFEAAHRGDPDYRSTTRDVARLIDELRSEKIDGIVLDLRNNGGGSLEEVQSLVGLFIRTGPVVQVRWANGKVEPDGDFDPDVHYDGPLAVMVNRLSASASEIFAAAIQDYGRGLIIGEQTFGKGTVQTLRPLNQGQLKITQAKFYRISGESTQLQGVMPDITFPGLVDHEEIGESALPNAMPWDTIRPARYTRIGDFSSMLPELRKRSEQRASANPDFQYVRDQLAMLAQSRAQKQLSLNEDTRRRERDQLRQQSLNIENKRRAARGEAPLKDFAEFEKINEDLAAAGDNAESPVDKAMLIEAGSVMADQIQLWRQRQAAAQKTGLPKTAS